MNAILITRFASSVVLFAIGRTSLFRCPMVLELSIAAAMTQLIKMMRLKTLRCGNKRSVNKVIRSVSIYS